MDIYICMFSSIKAEMLSVGLRHKLPLPSQAQPIHYTDAASNTLISSLLPGAGTKPVGYPPLLLATAHFFLFFFFFSFLLVAFERFSFVYFNCFG